MPKSKEKFVKIISAKLKPGSVITFAKRPWNIPNCITPISKNSKYARENKQVTLYEQITIDIGRDDVIAWKCIDGSIFAFKTSAKNDVIYDIIY